MGPEELALAAAVVAVGALVQGSIGFGMNVVAAPLAVLIDPAFVPGPLLVTSTLLVMLAAVREHRHIEFRGVGWTFAGRIPGTVLGGLAVAVLADDSLELLFGGLLLVGVGLTASRLRIERTATTMAGTGFVSGLMGTATSVGGPPIALVYQREVGPVIRGTLSAIFLVGSAISLGTLAAVGELGTGEIGTGLALMPGVAVGYLASSLAIKVLDRRSLRPVVLTVAALAALAVLVRALI